MSSNRREKKTFYITIVISLTDVPGYIENLLFLNSVTKLTATLNEISLSVAVGISQKRSAANLQV